MRRRLTRAAAATLTLRASAVLVNFLVNIAMARLLGLEGYGVFAVVLAWSMVLAVPAGLGFDRLIIRELARMQTRPDPSAARSLLRTATVAVTVSSALVGTAVLTAAFVAGDGDPTGSFGAIALGALLVPLLTLTTLRQGALQGLHRVARGQLADSLVRPATLLALIAFALWFRERPPMVTGTLMAVLAGAVGLVAVVLMWRSVARPILQSGSPAPGSEGAIASGEPAGGWLRAAVPLAFLTTAAAVSAQADVVLVGMLLDAEAAGVYAIAVRVSLLVSFPLTVLLAALAPTYASLIAAGDRSRLQRIVTSVSRGVTAVSVIMALGFVLFGGQILGLFGPGFGVGTSALGILVVGQTINAVFGPTSTLMLMGGFERRAAIDMAIGAAVKIVLVVALARTIGLEGAAIGSAAGLATWNMLMAIHLRTRTGIRTTVFGL